MLLVFLLYALFASVFTISKAGLYYTQPFFFVGSRMLLAGSFMLVFQYFYDRGKFYLKKEDTWRVLRLAVFNIYLTNMFEFWGLKYLTSFKTCLIYSLSPFLSALFSYFMFAERMTWKKWLGLLIGFMGLLPILLYESANEDLTGYFFLFSWAEISVICAAVCSVYGWILLRQFVREGGYSPIMANGASMVIGGGIALIHSAAVEPWNPLPVTEFVPFIECALLLILVSNLICYNLYGYLLKRFSATFMSFAGFTTPFFTALFGWLFLNEVIGLPFYFSSGILFVGLTLFYLEEIKQGVLTRKSEESLV